jgi:hypothetical protein
VLALLVRTTKINCVQYGLFQAKGIGNLEADRFEICRTITTYMPASGARKYGACLFLFEIVDKYLRKLVG